MAKPIIVIHYGEIALKGKNRGVFEKQLQANIRVAMEEAGFALSVHREWGRMLIKSKDMSAGGSLPDGFIKRLSEIPGITFFGVGLEVGYDIDEMTDAALALIKDLPHGSFKVETKRSEKSFPASSPEVNQRVGRAVVERYGLPVDLNNPSIVIRIEITFKSVYIFCARYRGVGGLPVGVSGRVVSMLSAGFDSPVASYLMMKRGAYVFYVHFHSAPYVSGDSIDQVYRLVKRLNAFQNESICYMIPFAEIQKKIIAGASNHYRVLLYRRAMIRIAERIGSRHMCEAIVTGESLGQVASQTLRNIRIVDESASMPVLRPLVGMDKEEIISIARKIGTGQISSEPHDDCCSFFMPRQVETWGDPEEVRSIENSIDISGICENALEDIEKLKVTDVRNRSEKQETKQE